MKNKTLRHILTIVWGVVFIINLSVCLLIPEPSFFSWILVGFSFGFLLSLLMHNPLINNQDDFIKFLIKSNSKLIEIELRNQEEKKKRVRKK